MSLAHSEYVPASESRFEPQPPTVPLAVPVITPLRDQVLVKREPPPDQIGAIYVPDMAKRWRTTEATVTAVGPGRHGKHGRLPPPCAVGDRVIVDKWAGDVVGSEGGAHLVILNATDILAVVG